MNKHRAIPPGYMTVGELAKKMNTTVSALQYYDREGILTPSEISEGGRRLYTDKDMVMLHQIQSLKYLGFSLDDIKHRLVSLETPEDVVAALDSQENAVEEQIASLTEVLETIRKLKEETIQMQTVNFRKYADIVSMLREGNNYWIVKVFSDEMWEHIRTRFDARSAEDYMERQRLFFADVAKLKDDGVAPDSEQGIEAGKKWHELITEFTGGDMSKLSEMLKFGENREIWDKKWWDAWEKIEGYLTEALIAYINTLGYNPFEAVEEFKEAAEESK